MKIIIKTQFILDLCVSAFFALISITIMTFILPEGRSLNFLFRSYKLIGLIFALLGIIFLFFWYFDKNFKFKKKFEYPELKNLILISLPISPIIDYALLNNEFLSTGGLLNLFFITFLFILFFSFILPILFSFFGSYYILMISGLALTFTILSIAKIGSNPNYHIFNSQFITQGTYLMIAFIILYFFYSLNKTTAYIFVFFFMISGVIINLYNNFNYNLTKVENSEKLVNFLKSDNNKIIHKKNIYLLVYESYPNLETLYHYGYDNSEQISFLEKNGFKVYHGSYSIASASLTSTSRILEIDNELLHRARYYVSGNAFVPKVLKNNGYKNIGLFKSSYFLDEASSIEWNEYYPKENLSKIGGRTLTKSIFQGAFKFDIFDEFTNYEDYLQLKEKYLSSIRKNTFFFTHNSYPGHSGNSGVCDSNEKNKYFSGMKKANTEMQNDVMNILKNDQNAIIVLLGDHGPYLTKNCKELRDVDVSTIDQYDIQDRYGAFLSIYWPKDISHKNYNIEVTQDIFPAVFSNITNNKNLFDELKVDRRFSDRFNNVLGGVNVNKGIIAGGKDSGKPLFNQRSYVLGH